MSSTKTVSLGSLVPATIPFQTVITVDSPEKPIQRCPECGSYDKQCCFENPRQDCRCANAELELASKMFRSQLKAMEIERDDAMQMFKKLLNASREVRETLVHDDAAMGYVTRGRDKLTAVIQESMDFLKGKV